MKQTPVLTCIIALGFLLALTGCDDGTKQKDELESLKVALNKMEGERDDLKAKLEALAQTRDQLRKRADALTKSRDALQKRVDELAQSLRAAIAGTQKAAEEKDNHLAANQTKGPPVSLFAPRAAQKGLITGITQGEHGPSAVIDNRIFHEGDTVGNITAVQIHRDRVVFEKAEADKGAILRWTQRIGEAPKTYWDK